MMTRIGGVCALLSLVVGTAGCNPQSLISKVTVAISQNLETVTVTLLFAPQIQETLAGSVAIKDYGDIFVNPSTTTAPFEIGFALNTKIVNDQDYVHLAPTEVLPNGFPIGIGYPVVQIQSVTPISTQFDLYAYVDVSKFSWLGVASIFNFLNDKNFPAGLTISQGFQNDSQGNPEILASVFGPELNPDGTMKVAGGIAVFANVRELVASGLTPGHPLILTPKR